MRRESSRDFLSQRREDIKHHPSDFSKNSTGKNKQPGVPKKTRKKIIFVFFLVLAGLLFTQQIFFSKQTVPGLKELTRLPVIREIRQLTGANNRQLKGESRDRINVLLMGQGGPGHPGPYLTDTMMLASFKPSTGQTAVLSIPRDMVIKLPEFGLQRINAANSYGETSNYPGGGANYAAKTLEDNLNVPINYYARVDFTGFEKFINDLGGVEVDIERAFTDYQYPDNNLGYQVVSFDAGLQELSGEQALQYVRSRHAEGEAGDFSRVKRQQNLLLAVKDEILTPNIFFNPGKLARLYKDLGKNFATNIQSWEIPLFLELAKNADFKNITFMVLDDSPAGPLYATTLENGAYVLAPKISDYSEIQFIVNNLFTINDIKIEGTKLVIQNGTAEEGLALNTAAILSSFEFNIIKISNAPSQNFEETVLFDLTGDTKKKSKMFLENTLQTKSLDTLPMTEEDLGDADFLIILGRDQVPSAHASQSNSINTTF